jgi:hypothetical protein
MSPRGGQNARSDHRAGGRPVHGRDIEGTLPG